MCGYRCGDWKDDSKIETSNIGSTTPEWFRCRDSYVVDSTDDAPPLSPSTLKTKNVPYETK